MNSSNRSKKEVRQASLARNQGLVRQINLRLNKERERLDLLNEMLDPAVQSLVEVGQVYIRLKMPNEARVALRRAKAFCKEDQRKEITYSVILTYAMQGLVQKADQAFLDYQKEFPNDPKADNVSVLIAEELFKLKDFQGAFDQYQKSLKDYPRGRYASLAAMKSAACKVQMGKTEEGIKILQEFVAANKESEYVIDAQFNLAQAYINLNQHEEAIKVYRTILDNPKAQAQHPSIQLRIASTYSSIKKFDEAIQEWKIYREKYKEATDLDRVLGSMAAAAMQKGDFAQGQQLFEQILTEYISNKPLAVSALRNLSVIYAKQNKTDDRIKSLLRVMNEFGSVQGADEAVKDLADYFEKQNDPAKTAENQAKATDYFNWLIQNKSTHAPWAQFRLGVMNMKSATSMGVYTALNDQEKAKWTESLKKAEEAQVAVLKNYPQSNSVGFSLQELLRQVLLKTDSGIYTLEQAQGYFKELSTQFSEESMKSRLLLTGAGIPFEKGNAAVALQSYEEIIKQFPAVQFTANDLNRYGSSLITEKNFVKAQEVFKNLQEGFPKDARAQSDAIYGQGAALLFQGKVEEAGKFFEELKQKYSNSPRIIEATLGVGLAAEQAGKLDEALASYRSVIMNQNATVDLKAKATLGRARIFELTGSLFPDPAKKDTPAASMEYERVAALYASEKDSASEALYRLGILYSKNGKMEEAKNAFQRCIEKYKGSQWATEAASKLQ